MKSPGLLTKDKKVDVAAGAGAGDGAGTGAGAGDGLGDGAGLGGGAVGLVGTAGESPPHAVPADRIARHTGTTRTPVFIMVFAKYSDSWSQRDATSNPRQRWEDAALSRGLPEAGGAEARDTLTLRARPIVAKIDELSNEVFHERRLGERSRQRHRPFDRQGRGNFASQAVRVGEQQRDSLLLQADVSHDERSAPVVALHDDWLDLAVQPMSRSSDRT